MVKNEKTRLFPRISDNREKNFKVELSLYLMCSLLLKIRQVLSFLHLITIYRVPVEIPSPLSKTLQLSLKRKSYLLWRLFFVRCNHASRTKHARRIFFGRW